MVSNSLDKLHIALNSFHDDFEDFIELVGGEAFDVLCAGIEVASDVGEDGEMSIDRSGISFKDFKVCVASRQTEPNTLVISDCMVEYCLNSYLGVLVEEDRKSVV